MPPCGGTPAAPEWVQVLNIYILGSYEHGATSAGWDPTAVLHVNVHTADRCVQPRYYM